MKEKTMADDEKKEPEQEEGTEVLKEVEVEYGEISLSTHPKIRAIGKFCDLYIGIEENFQLMGLNDELVKHQKKYLALYEKMYETVFGKPFPKVPEPEPDRSKMTQEEKEKEKKQQLEFSDMVAELSTKKIKLKFPEIRIAKDVLQKVMDREEAKTKQGQPAVLITPNDIAMLRDLITFI